MTVRDQLKVMTIFNDAHSELEFINSVTSGIRHDHQSVVATTISNAVSWAVSNALSNLSLGLFKVPIGDQLLLTANKPTSDTSPTDSERISQSETKSTSTVITLTSASLTKMEVITLIAKMLKKQIGRLCGSLANSAGHMATSTVFINTLPNMLSKIVASQLHGQTMGTKNTIISIEDSLQYICETLDDVMSLSHTFREMSSMGI